MTQQQVDDDHRDNARAARAAESRCLDAMADVARAKDRGVFAGARVVFGSKPTHHGRVHGFGADVDGQATVAISMCGVVVWHAALLSDVRAVCGECEDCKALNDRPECMR